MDRLGVMLRIRLLAACFGLGALFCAGATVPAMATSYDEGRLALNAGDAQRAFEIWQPLAEGGDALSQYGLGKLFKTGAGEIPADPERAAFWYDKAAQQGVASAQNNLGLMFAKGQGVERNMGAAILLWDMAGRGNHPQAQYNLGLVYYNGNGVPPDIPQAAIWFGLAAENGLAEAQFAVGEMHRLGVALPQDNQRALGWYDLAAAQGHQEAASYAERLRAGGVIAVPVAGSFNLSQLPPSPVQSAEGAPADIPAPPPPTRPGDEETEETATPAPEPAPAPTPEVVEQPAPAPEVAEAPAPAPAPVPAPEVAEAPAPEPAPEAVEQPAPAPQVAAAPPSGGAYKLWLASLGDESAAQAFWGDVAGRFPELQAAEVEVSRAELAGEVFYRLLAVGWSSEADARSVCAQLRASDPLIFCKIVGP